MSLWLMREESNAFTFTGVWQLQVHSQKTAIFAMQEMCMSTARFLIILENMVIPWGVVTHSLRTHGLVNNTVSLLCFIKKDMEAAYSMIALMSH